MMAFGPYKDAINRAAAKHGVPAPLLAGLLAQESGFRPSAIGDNGASVGMGQFNVRGALADFGLSREQVLRMAPEQQIDLAANFYRQKINQAGGDPLKGLVRYNGGGDPNYLQHVLSRVPGNLREDYRAPTRVDVRMAGDMDNAGMPVPTGDPVTGESDLTPIEIFNALKGIEQTGSQQNDEADLTPEEIYQSLAPKENRSRAPANPLRAFGTGFAQGGTMYWGDELAGGLHRVGNEATEAARSGAKLLGSVVSEPVRQVGGQVVGTAIDALTPDNPNSLSALYATPADATAASRQALTQARQQYPWWAFGGEVAGGVALGGLTRGATRPIPLPVLGATEGAIAGAGSGNSLRDRVTMAVIGSGFGAAVPTAMSVLGAGVRSLTSRAGERLRPETAGNVLVRRAAEADDMTANDIMGAMDQLGPEAMPADVGANLRMLTKQTANAPGPAARIVDDAMTTRQAGSVQRVLNAAGDDVLPPGAQGYGEFLDEVQTQLGQQARPWYERAYRGMVPNTPVIRQLVEDYPEAHQAALLKARRDPTVSPDMRAVISAMNDGADVEQVPMQYVDLLKRAMDDEIGSLINKGLRDDVRIATARKNILLGHLDDLGQLGGAQQRIEDNPFASYRRAREIYAGGKALENAAELGASALRDTQKTTVRQIRRATETMTESEMLAFRIGMMDAIEQKVARAVTETQTPADVASKLMRTADLQRRLSLAFRGREAQTQQFLDRLRAESQMKFTYNQTRPTIGAQTGQLNVANNELAGQLGAGAAIFDAANGRYGGTVQALIRFIGGKRRQRPEVMAAAARVLTNQNITQRDIEQIMRAGDTLTTQAAGPAPISRAATRAGLATTQDQQQP